jgi:hypothetical protein
MDVVLEVVKVLWGFLRYYGVFVGGCFRGCFFFVFFWDAGILGWLFSCNFRIKDDFKGICWVKWITNVYWGIYFAQTL